MNRLWGWMIAVLMTSPASAQSDPIATAADVPTAVQADFEAAEAAWKAGRLDEATEAFARVTQAAPDWDRGWRRRCGAVLELGDTPAAIAHCRTALGRATTPENRVALAIALLRPEDEEALPQGRPELDEAGGLLNQVTTENPEIALAWPALCEWAIATSDADALRRCVPEVRARLPDDPGTPFWAALLAIEEGQPDVARKMLAQARERGVDPRLLAVARTRLEGATAPPKREGPKTVAWDDLAPVGAAGAVLLFVGLAMLSRGRASDARSGSDDATPRQPASPTDALPTHASLHPAGAAPSSTRERDVGEADPAEAGPPSAP